MKHRFQCTIVERKFENPCTIRLVDGLETEDVNWSREGTVYQLHSDGRRTAVFQLQHTVSMTTEDMWTKLRYFGGCLSHHTYFDAPIFPMHDYHLPDGKVGFTLDDSARNGLQSKLECEGKCYPVWHCPPVSGRNDPLMIVYKPEPEQDVPLAEITCTDRRENQRTYEIRMGEVNSPLLCLAICSLII